MQGIGFWLRKREMLNPGKEAVVDGRRRVSYRELNHRVNRLSRGLQDLGLRHGDRVGILAYNCLEFVEVIMAAAKLGLILVPLNWRLTPAEIGFNLSDSQTASLVVDAELLEKAEAVAAQVVIERQIVIGEAPSNMLGYDVLPAGQKSEEPVPDRSVDLETPHIIMYTAGTREYKARGIDLQQGFGMSEAAPSIATLSRDLALKKAGSIGKAVYHLEVIVADEQLQELPRGEVGELMMRGPNLMQEYWKRPEASDEAFAGGWFHSGDLAWMDADGDIYIVERKKDMFISGGENVYPAEVENAIYELPQVSEAAVIGVKHEKWGEVGLAVVVPKPGAELTEKQLLEHLRERLARYKVPGTVVFEGQLPRNAAGKVLKTELRERFRST